MARGDVEETYRTRLMALAPSDRVEMAGRMFHGAKVLALAGLRADGVARTEKEERAALFERLYGSDFTPEQRRAIVAHLLR